MSARPRMTKGQLKQQDFDNERENRRRALSAMSTSTNRKPLMTIGNNKKTFRRPVSDDDDPSIKAPLDQPSLSTSEIIEPHQSHTATKHPMPAIHSRQFTHFFERRARRTCTRLVPC